MENSMEEYWMGVYEYGGDKKKINALRWDVYIKDKEELIKREVLVSVAHPKGVGGYLDLCEG